MAGNSLKVTQQISGKTNSGPLTSCPVFFSLSVTTGQFSDVLKQTIPLSHEFEKHGIRRKRFLLVCDPKVTGIRVCDNLSRKVFF